MEWTAEQLARAIADKYPPSAGELKVCWVVAPSGRSALAKSLASQVVGEGLRVVPLVLREDLFESPNAVLEDLRRLMEGARDVIEERMADATAEDTIVLTVVSLCPLTVPQVSSPVELPPWLPAFGGLAPTLRIDDLETSAYGPMDSPAARIDRLKSSLFDCDCALLGRLRDVADVNRNAVAGFWDDIRDSSREDEKVGDFMESASAYLGTVHNSSGYRLNLTAGNTVVARIVRLVGCRTPDQVAKSGERFLNAMALGDESESSLRLSLFGALSRTYQRMPNDRRTVGSNLLSTVYAAHLFTTAAAHSDSYAPQLLSAMSATSQDLADALSRLAMCASLADGPL